MSVLKVLIIDDDPDVLRSVGNYFDRLGHQVIRAATGEEGIQAWRKARPDVSIVDLHLPGIDGLEVLEQLRRDRAVVIMLTGSTEVSAAVEAMRLGAENFLTKPIEMAHLQQAVEKAAEKASLVRETARLRELVRPNWRRRLQRGVAVVVLVLVSLFVGRALGIGGRNQAPLPIPVPVDTVPTVP